MCWAIISNLNHFPANTIGLCSTAVQWLRGFQWEILISAMVLCAFANQRHLHYVKTISDCCSAVLIPSFCKIKGPVLVVSGAHISISACWCKGVFFLHMGTWKVFLHNTFFLFQCKIPLECNRTGSARKPPWQPGIPASERQLIPSTEVSWCHKTWHLLPLQLEGDASGMPFRLGGQSCAFLPRRCSNISLPKAAVHSAAETKRASLPVSRRDMFPILQGM